jgi:hypothetical protein
VPVLPPVPPVLGESLLEQLATIRPSEKSPAAKVESFIFDPPWESQARAPGSQGP